MSRPMLSTGPITNNERDVRGVYKAPTSMPNPIKKLIPLYIDAIWQAGAVKKKWGRDELVKHLRNKGKGNPGVFQRALSRMKRRKQLHYNKVMVYIAYRDLKEDMNKPLKLKGER